MIKETWKNFLENLDHVWETLIRKTNHQKCVLQIKMIEVRLVYSKLEK